MSKKIIKLSIAGIVDREGQVPYNATITGRLLGAMTGDEAEKFLSCEKIQDRTFTRPTVSVEDASIAMDNILKASKLDFGRLLVAVKTIDGLETYAKQLYLTPPISIFNELNVDKENGKFLLSIDCTDDTVISIQETE